MDKAKFLTVCGYDSGLSLSYSSCPAVSHRPRLTVLPSTTTLALWLSNTVGMYSVGNSFFVYVMSRDVFPV